jgi:hypothetical protein
MQEDDISDGGEPDSPSPLALALDVLSVLKHAGLTTVECEPTAEMVAVGVAVSGNGPERVRAMFRAMIAVGGKPFPRQQ